VSLRVRLAAIVAVTFAIVVVGCIYAAHVSARNSLHQETDRFLTQRSQDPRITNGLRGDNDRDDRPGGFPPPPGVQAEPEFADPDALVQFIRPNGTVAFASQPALPVSASDRAVAAGTASAHFNTTTVDDQSYRVLTVPVNGGAAQIAREVSSTNNVLDSLDLRLLLIALAGTLVAALLAWFIARRIVRPVEALTGASERIAATQDLEHTIEVDRTDELGRLASSFNTMLIALRNSREQQHRLVMDASHELRTPLTALRTNIEVLQRSTSEMDEGQRAELLGEVEAELSELTELVAELVDLATDARGEEPMQDVDLGALVENVVERARRRTGRDITFEVCDPATVTARPAAIDRAVWNLLDNANKFSPPGAPVAVRVADKRIEVEDRGPGIAHADREHVFDRFYRAPEARTAPGSGLGLSIVKQIADLHHATIEINDRPGSGAIISINFP
jgi:two-component system sensor histidine kinase MprB